MEGIATDTTKLDRFMDALFQLRSERILDSSEVKTYNDELLQKPNMEFVITDLANRTYPLTYFHLGKKVDM